MGGESGPSSSGNDVPSRLLPPPGVVANLVGASPAGARKWPFIEARQKALTGLTKRGGPCFYDAPDDVADEEFGDAWDGVEAEEIWGQKQ